MRYEKNRKILGFDEYKFMKYLKIISIPVLILIVIFIVVFLDILGDKNKGKAKVEESIQVFIPSDELVLKEVPEITDLIRHYQNAHLTADANLFVQVFGRSADTADENFSKSFKDKVKNFEYFSPNIETYVADGINENEYVVFTKIYLKFKKAEILAPIFLASYIVNDNGTYRILLPSDMSREQSERYKFISEKEEAQKLYADYKLELEKAVLEDINISDNYKDLVAGEIRFEDKEKTLERLAAIEESKKMAQSEEMESSESSVADEEATNDEATNDENVPSENSETEEATGN